MMLSVWVAVIALGATTPAAPASAPNTTKQPTPVQAGSGDGSASPEATLTEPVVPPTADDDQKPPAPKPGFGGNFILDNSVPSGTFIFNNAYTFNPAVTTSLYLRPSYTFSIGSQSLKAEVWQNFTYADFLDKNSAVTERLTWSDTRISVYDNKIYEEPHTKIAIGAYVRGSIPISYQSQFQGLITQLAGGVNLKKNVYNFNLQIGLAASKNFNRMTTAAFPCSSSAIGPLTLVPGEAPDVSQADVLEGFQNGICRPGDTTTKTSLVNTDWALIPNGSVAYNFTDKLQLSVAFYYLSSFQYPVPLDQFSPQGTTTSGQAVVSGQQRSDSLWGITSLSYAIDPHWGLSLGLWNVALPKTANGSTFRFPLLDTYALNSNDWNLFFDVSATF